jgi:hypothetical protein
MAHTHIIPLLAILYFVPLCFAVPSGGCPDDSMVYSPFKPFFQWTHPEFGSGCWWWAGCVFVEADECRKQQFAATSLVMGLVPLVLKDIAWPERRLVRISQRLPRLLEILVRAMGIVPVVDPRRSKHIQGLASKSLYTWTFRQTRGALLGLVAICSVFLAFAFTSTALTEIYSKRSSLGCPYPVFILTWHLVAVVPAAINVILFKDGTKDPDDIDDVEVDPAVSFTPTPQTSDPDANNRSFQKSATQGLQATHSTSDNSIQGKAVPGGADAYRRSKMNGGGRTDKGTEDESSAIQGGGQLWLIQLVWAVYYTAGTLIYASIMAVTVIELTVWVLVSVAVAAAYKLLAFFLCMYHEKGLKLPRSGL